MPLPAIGIGGALLGSAAVGGVSSIMAGRSQAKAAGKAADASVASTAMQIDAARQARDEAVAASREGNEIATRAQTAATRRAAQSELYGSRKAENALLAGNAGAADSLIYGANRARRSTAYGSKKAEKAEVGANLRNIDLFRSILDDQAASGKAWRVAGTNAIKQIDAGLADGSFGMDGWQFQADPGYQFRLDQGNRAIERSAAARGGVLSGNAVAAAQDFSSGLASQEYAAAYERERAARQAEFDRLSATADRGYNAISDLNAQRDAYGSRVAGARLNIADARGTGAMTRAQAAVDARNTIARTRAGELETRGNILATGATDRAGIMSRRYTDLGNIRATGALNVANTTAGGALNVGNVAASAYGQQGVNLANAALAKGQAGANAWQGVNEAAQGGLSNWLTLDMLSKAGVLGGAG